MFISALLTIIFVETVLLSFFIGRNSDLNFQLKQVKMELSDMKSDIRKNNIYIKKIVVKYNEIINYLNKKRKN